MSNAVREPYTHSEGNVKRSEALRIASVPEPVEYLLPESEIPTTWTNPILEKALLNSALERQSLAPVLA